MRSPGESPLKITKKNVEQIFKDPVFNHKAQIFKLEEENRKNIIGTVEKSILKLKHKLEDPHNYK